MKLKKIIYPVIAAVLIAGAIFYVGYAMGAKKSEIVVVEGLSGIESEEVKIDFRIFWDVWDKVKTEHINGESAEDQDLVYGAVAGMVNALKDPNTVFLSPADAKKFEEDVSGSFGGIGAEIGIRGGQLVIVAPLKNTPAERAGLLAGDQILQVNDTGTDGLNVNEAVKIIRGDPGTEVRLLIYREDWDEPREIKIIREIIKVPTIESEILTLEEGSKIAHIRLYSFNENASAAFYRTLLDAATSEVRGVIIDLRNNPGGFLEVAVNLAGWYVERGKAVVTERFRSGKDRVFRSSGNAALKEVPTVLLVNKGSASASEILAGTLRDHLGIKLVGEQTFGKGSVQELQKLRDNSTLKITVAQWVLPKGDIIEKIGLKPDFEVSISEEDAENKKDTQLEKAIEILKTIIAQ